MILEDAVVSEICHSQRTNTVPFQIDEVPQMVKLRLPGAGEEGDREVLLNRYTVSVCKIKKLWRWVVVMVAQQYEWI